MKKIIILAAALLILAACSDNEEVQNSGSANDNAPTDAQSVTDHGVVDKSNIGFEMAGGDIEEATNVPANEKEAILGSFNQYIHAFNEEDLDGYLGVISKNPEGFDYAQEKEVVKQAFEDYNTIRTANDVTIIKYEDKEAQVYANLDISLSQPESGTKLDRKGRQVTVFKKEEGKWVVTSVYYIGETAE